MTKREKLRFRAITLATILNLSYIEKLKTSPLGLLALFFSQLKVQVTEKNDASPSRPR